jgi:hypothetical protein
VIKQFLNWFATAPSWVWVFLFPLGIIAFIGSIIGFIYLLANVEGFASIIFILVGWGVGRGLAAASRSQSQTKIPGFVTGGAICFYALMGMAIDQPGNYFFNKPIEWFGCPAGTSLNREVDVSHPLPGRTDMVQDFQCFNAQGEQVGRASMDKVIGIRFLEYVLVAYFFMGVHLLQYQLVDQAKK